MILAVVIDGEGRPICTEMPPGNTADTTVLLPVVDRLRERFHIGRVCVVADRGMISAATIAALEERKLEYILGARERSSAVVRRLVLEDEQPLTPLLVERARGATQLFIKEVKIGAARYILCRNEAEAQRDRGERQAIVAGLSKQLARGDKALIGNSAYRRYLRRASSADGKPGPAFEIDPGKLAEEARFDGVFVLRTNARVTPLQAVLRYRDLLQVEDLFRRAKAILRTRPIYHSSDTAIRGHVFCSFLALMLQKADAAKGAGRSVPAPRPRHRMGRPAARSRPPAGGHDREGRQAHHHPHRRRRPGRQRLSGRRHRPATQSARTRRLIDPPARV